MNYMDKSKRTQGFSIVEMVIVMAIMGFVVMAVMSLFIPAKRASVVQAQLSDVQSNLRLAIDRITKDIRNAGFLVTGNSISGYDAGTLESSSLVITTRSAVSGHFGRITEYANSWTDDYTLLYENQIRFFKPGAYVAVVHPLTGNVLGDGYFEVCTTNAATRKVTVMVDCDSNTTLTSAQKEAMDASFNAPENLLLPAPNPSILPSPYTQADLDANMIRTITYALEGDALTREIVPPMEPGGTTKQYLARNISDLRFIVSEDADGDVFRVIIEVAGETGAAGKDAIGSAKTKRYRTVVSLRNI